MKSLRIFGPLLLLLPTPLMAQTTPEDYQEDAQQLIEMVQQAYAYPERFEDSQIPVNAVLQAQADAVSDSSSLLHFAENLLLILRDHHAITGSSASDSWAVVPSYADLWIVYRDGEYLVDAVRNASPAEQAGILPGTRLTEVAGVPIAQAIDAFWNDLGDDTRDAESKAFAARVLVAGRRDRPRILGLERAGGAVSVELPNLYQGQRSGSEPVTVTREGDTLRVRFNDSLGNNATIAALDNAMELAGDAERVLLDLTDTPSGGNTVVARGIMGWFVDQPSPYQIHTLPAEQRQTGIARQWAEYIVPREGKNFDGHITVRVGRWTGSMGEGLAIGLQAQGAELEGHEMAGLLGAVYDLTTSNTGLLIKLPIERLYTVGGVPREDVTVP